jgi:hypothetical protein
MGWAKTPSSDFENFRPRENPLHHRGGFFRFFRRKLVDSTDMLACLLVVLVVLGRVQLTLLQGGLLASSTDEDIKAKIHQVAEEKN